jgi:hypothetical protein
MDHCHNHAKERDNKQIVRSRLPEQKQKAAKGTAKNGYRKTHGGPCGSVFDYRTLGLAIGSDHIRIHLYKEIYDARNIPDQRDRANYPETPVNTANYFISHRILLLFINLIPG